MSLATKIKHFFKIFWLYEKLFVSLQKNLKNLKMETLYNYITCFLNNIQYNKLLVEHTLSRLKHVEWFFDWCTPEEFVTYLVYLWELNRKNFKDGFTFDDFYSVQVMLAYYNPEYFKIKMIGLGFIKKHKNS